MNYDLSDKVAVVTGGSRGIGLAAAGELLAQGCRVAICARKQEGLDKAVAELGGGERLFAFPAHVGKAEDVNAFFHAVIEKFGCIDLLIANVGMNLMVPETAKADLGLWQKIIDTNLTGAFLSAKAAAAPMMACKQGAMVFVTSIAAQKAAMTMGVYGVAKAGVEQLTRVLAVELAGYNIRVNAVAPAMVKTDFSKPFWGDEKMHAHIVKTIPLGRLAEPMDVVHPALFLCSPGAAFVTGQTLTIDGGSGVS